jgi:hypothetical protein
MKPSHAALLTLAVPLLVVAAESGAFDDATLRSPRFDLVDVAEAASPAEREFIGPAVAAAQAERGERVQVTPTLPEPVAPVEPTITPGPSGTAVEGRCTQYEPLLAEFAGVGWDVQRMSRIMWRESRCTPSVVSNTGCCVSLLQLYVGLHLRDHRLAPRYNECGVYGWGDLDGADDVRRHVCAAAALYSVVGIDAWAATK